MQPSAELKKENKICFIISWPKLSQNFLHKLITKTSSISIVFIFPIFSHLNLPKIAIIIRQWTIARVLPRIALVCIAALTLIQICFNWTKIADLSAENARLQEALNSINFKRGKQQSHPQLPQIIFVTPSAYRTAQKADLTRLGQTLASIANLFWIIVEDSPKPSAFIDTILARLGITGVHLVAMTQPRMKANATDPAWKYPRGVEQRNAALRENLPSPHQQAILYFGDDDNTYDWRLFDEMRKIRRVGVWPVGIVGGQLVETPLIAENGSVVGFNARWKPRRPFPLDMAAFGVNLSLVHAHPTAAFSYGSPRGQLESDFLLSLGLTRADLEPLAKNCTMVLVWHTRTERLAFQSRDEQQRFLHHKHNELSPLQLDAIA